MVLDEAEWTTPIGNALEGSYLSSVRFQIMQTLTGKCAI